MIKWLPEVTNREAVFILARAHIAIYRQASKLSSSYASLLWKGHFNACNASQGTCSEDREGTDVLTEYQLLSEDLLNVLLPLHRDALHTVGGDQTQSETHKSYIYIYS